MTGPRVALVKSAGRADAFAAAVHAAGGVPVLVAPFRREDVPHADAYLRAALLPPPDWVAVTSPHAAAVIGRVLPRGAGVRVAAVGPGTASALHSAGVRPDLIGDGGGTELGEALLAAGCAAGDTVVHAAGEPSRPELRARLAAEGVEVVTVSVYRMVPDPVGERSAAGRFDAVVVGSPRLAARAAELFEPRPPVVAIGRTTAAALRDLGWAPAAVAARPTPDDVEGALRSVIAGPDRSPPPGGEEER